MRLTVYAFEGLFIAVGVYVFIAYYVLPFAVELRNKKRNEKERENDNGRL